MANHIQQGLISDGHLDIPKWKSVFNLKVINILYNKMI